MEKTDNPKKKKSSQKSRQPDNLRQYSKYSGMAFQMIAAILLGLWIGTKIDDALDNEKHVFTAITTLVFLLATLFLIIRSLTKS
ncbi:MAG: AtpZ/AtpI family protein [Cyclobacteriaceae bacterium]